MSEQRNNVYDIAKCLAIVSVAAYHVEFLIFPNNYLHAFINTFFLTLFFVISGLLTKSYKISQNGWLMAQVKHLLVPFISGFLLYNLTIGILKGKVLDLSDTKSGYWFLFSLFEFYVVLWMIGKYHKTNKAVKLLLLFIPFVAVSALCSVISYDAAGLLSLFSFRRYWLFFAYGYALTNIGKSSIIYNNKVGACATLLYLILGIAYVVNIQDVHNNIDFAVWFVTNLAGCHFWLFVIKKLESVLSQKAILQIGKNTLGIYVFHYYPLYLCTILLGGVLCENFICTATLFLLAVICILTLSYFLTILFKKQKFLVLLFLGKQ